MRSNVFDRLSFLLLFLVVVLLPVFCLPFTNIPVETSKSLLLVVGLTLAIIFWAIARFYDGKIIIPKSRILLLGGVVVLATLLSALWSGHQDASLFGTMFDIGSFWFIFTSFILMLFSAIIFNTAKKAKTVMLGVIVSSFFVLIFQAIHIFIPIKTSLGVLAGKTGNVVGSWNAFGLFTGFTALLFLLVVEFFPISKFEKLLLQIFILLAILLAAVVNFSLIWILLGISSLIIFVYKVSVAFQKHNDGDAGNEKKYFFVISFAIVVIAVLFFMSGPLVGGFIPNRLQISNTEVSPSFAATMSITKGVLMHHPVFGIGPNRFGIAWSMYKPAIINSTQFWDVSFDTGSGLLPTFTATCGLVGILAWLAFFIAFLLMGFKSVISGIKKSVNWEMMAFFVLSLYLFISSFFYFTGPVIFLLAFSFAGVFIALSTSSLSKEIVISFLDDHRKSFFSIMVLILLVIASLGLTFTFLERFASVSYFGQSLSASTITTAESSINKALSLSSNDLYLRTYSQIYLIKLNTLAGKGGTLSNQDKTNLQASFDQAVGSAQLAASYDSQNYLNFQSLGSVYQTLGSLGVKDAYSKAIVAYQTASSLNPLNPGLKLAIAGVSFIDGKVADAKDYTNQALALKPDYVDALVTMSQILKSEGNMSGAISYAEAALSLSPTDKNLIAYVDSLKNPSPASATTPSTPKKSKK